MMANAALDDGWFRGDVFDGRVLCDRWMRRM